jgi:DNA-binding NtrC family response regulator
MRILVLDEGRLLPWLVARALGPGYEVEEVDGFERAIVRIGESRPDLVVVGLTRARLPWWDLQHLCATQRPVVPVLYESCVHAGPEELGLTPLEGRADFLVKPAPSTVLRGALRRLLG